MNPIEKLSAEQFEALVRDAVALPEVPKALSQAARALWPARPGLLARLAAELRFDSWATPALALGMRAARGETRHLLYSAGGRDIDLRLSPQPAGWRVAGQVLGPDESARVELAPLAGGAALEAALNEFGEFGFDAVPRGQYTLALQVADATIEISPVEVGGPEP